MKYFFCVVPFPHIKKKYFKNISTAWYFYSFILEPRTQVLLGTEHYIDNLEFRCLWSAYSSVYVDHCLHARNICYKKNKKVWMSPMSGKLYVSLCKSHFQRTDVFKYSRTSRRKRWGLRNSVLSYFYCIIMLTEEKKRPMSQSHTALQIHRRTAYKGCKEGRRRLLFLPQWPLSLSLGYVPCFALLNICLNWNQEKKGGGGEENRNILYFTKLGLRDSLEQNLFKKWNKNLIFISRIPQLFSHIKSFST